MSQVPYTEKAFLQMVARRILKFRREAEARGEEYHDLSAHAPLQCGIHAKLRYDPCPGGYRPVVSFRHTKAFDYAEMKEIASEILDTPAKLSDAPKDDLEYVREMDASVMVPG